MSADVLLAWLLVAVLVLSPWLATFVVGALFGAGLAGCWQQRRLGGVRDQRIAVARLSVRTASLEATVIAERQRSERAHGHAAALAEDVVALQHQLAAATERLRLAELDKRTEWEEVDPR